MSVVSSPHNYTTKDPTPLWIIKEDARDIPHDSLFKQLIQTFFEEFMEAFFPKLHQEIDFKSVHFLSAEVIPDAFKGEKRFLDLVVEARWKKTNTTIVIHLEPQSYVQHHFNKRMFKYYSQLYIKLNKPIIPIAIFNYEDSWNVNQFSIKVGDLKLLHFKYLTLHLRSKYWRDFIRKENPASAVLMSQMGYDRKEKVEVKLEFLRLLQGLSLDEEKKLFLYRFFDVYVKLSRSEEEYVMSKIKQEEEFDISSLPIAIEERAKEIGQEIGHKEGEVSAQEKIAIAMLKDEMPIEKVKKYIDLPKDRIEKLKKNI